MARRVTPPPVHARAPPTRIPLCGARAEKEARKALEAAGVAPRDTSSCRDTYATLALNKGLQPAWITQQMGNSPAVMLKHYARFTKTGDDRNLALLNAPDVEETGQIADGRVEEATSQ